MILPSIQMQAFNVFRHKATEYVQEFQDDPAYMRVARTILDLCLADLNQFNHEYLLASGARQEAMPVRSEAPNGYANPNHTLDDICHMVRQDLDNTLINESRFTRSLIRGFCCPGGMYRLWLEELLHEYNVCVNV
jgi:hypothetical protein